MPPTALSLYTRSGQRKYLNQAERRRFMEAALSAPAEIRTFCLTLAYTGCRISEALSLRAEQVGVESGQIAVFTLKRRGQLVMREIPVPASLLSELTRVHGLGRGEARLWSWGRTSAWRAVKVIMDAAGVRALPATPKGLRHGFGVHAVLCGVPLTLVQKWLGHADIATTAIYTNVLGPEERAIAERMW